MNTLENLNKSIKKDKGPQFELNITLWLMMAIGWKNTSDSIPIAGQKTTVRNARAATAKTTRKLKSDILRPTLKDPLTLSTTMILLMRFLFLKWLKGT
jgi:hypothetical protein